MRYLFLFLWFFLHQFFRLFLFNFLFIEIRCFNIIFIHRCHFSHLLLFECFIKLWKINSKLNHKLFPSCINTTYPSFWKHNITNFTSISLIRINFKNSWFSKERNNIIKLINLNMLYCHFRREMLVIGCLENRLVKTSFLFHFLILIIVKLLNWF